MLKIYTKDDCVFSAMVLAKIDELHIDVEEKNVSDSKNIDEMIAIGGKKQEPFLVDEDNDVHMYESHAIVEYLEEKYGTSKSEEERA
jgi:glutathione S-transferase